MIRGKKRVRLTPDVVLNVITAFDIFRFYMPNRNWEVNKQTYSPFRQEDNPSFVIGDRGGSLHFIDFADLTKRGGPFDFVMMRYGLTLDEVLQKIDSDFGLGFGSEKRGNYKEIVSEYKQPESLGKRYSLIQVITRKFTNVELSYWNSYHQSEDDLRSNHVYSIKEVYLNRQRFPITDQIRFGYLYEGCWKIYRPFAKTKKEKWLSNVPLTLAYGLENLSKGYNSLVTKSLKDYMVCKKVYPYVCHVQNESIAAFSRETVDIINNNSDVVFYGGDSDQKGKDASYIITSAFGWKHINPPDRLLPNTKDFADWGRLEGLGALEQHFKIKELYV